jgi:hypothetical protein
MVMNEIAFITVKNIPFHGTVFGFLLSLRNGSGRNGSGLSRNNIGYTQKVVRFIAAYPSR